jgi:hypothetical protein
MLAIFQVFSDPVVRVKLQRTQSLLAPASHLIQLLQESGLSPGGYLVAPITSRNGAFQRNHGAERLKAACLHVNILVLLSHLHGIFTGDFFYLLNGWYDMNKELGLTPR